MGAHITWKHVPTGEHHTGRLHGYTDNPRVILVMADGTGHVVAVHRDNVVLWGDVA